MKVARERDMTTRPHVICHMLSSVDGKIDGSSLRAVMRAGEYEATGARLNGDAWVCGRTTMQQHFAGAGPYVSQTNTPAGPQPVFVARLATSYAISVDTHGKLNWSGGDLHGDHLSRRRPNVGRSGRSRETSR
jgi:2,5-diamino-6-(ribosylamino)-4(3H)-pyrimidinone 5'-phosphate reductase